MNPYKSYEKLWPAEDMKFALRRARRAIRIQTVVILIESLALIEISARCIR